MKEFECGAAEERVVDWVSSREHAVVVKDIVATVARISLTETLHLASTTSVRALVVLLLELVLGVTWMSLPRHVGCLFSKEPKGATNKN